jgi:hypothetical protein
MPPAPPPTHQLIGILSASIAPVIVISGVGLLLLSMTNRYTRVVDRVRQFTEELGEATDPKRRDRLERELMIVYRRAKILRVSIILASVSILLIGVTVFSLFASQILEIEDFLSVPLFALSLLALIASLYFSIRDIGLSLVALDIEVKPYLDGK